MKSKWLEEKAAEFVSKYAETWGQDLALRTYSSRLLGSEKRLVLHGGGNVSVKGSVANVLGESVPAVFVKASGRDLANIEPEGHAALDLGYLGRLRALSELSDDAMLDELLAHRFKSHAPAPSIEALMHAFIPRKYIDHTHSSAILALTNRAGGDKVVRDTLGPGVIVLGYVKPGFSLAKAAAQAYESSPESVGMVLLKHGLVTWGDSARESYERTVSLVTEAENYLSENKSKAVFGKAGASMETAMRRYLKVAPVLRGLLAVPTGDQDRPYKRVVLRPLITEEVLDLVDSDRGKKIALTPPLTSDHLIKTKALPLWVDRPDYDSEENLAEGISSAIVDYASKYDAYLERNSERMSPGLTRFDSMPRVVLLPGLGAVCAGRDVDEAETIRDITEETLTTKAQIAASGVYEGLKEAELFDMEYFTLQHRKLRRGGGPPLRRTVALVTGAAGAIGSGICEELLRNGAHVAVTDLPGEALESFGGELRSSFFNRVTAAPLDVTDAGSVSRAFDHVIQAWGGIDLIVANAGIAHVSSLAEMDPDEFRDLERVNVEGTLHILSEAARHFKFQGTGGDIVLISTKNVFAPGAQFGAYSATKAAAHQLARIASLELAPLDVRVNMVSPDAVFSHSERKSGLWAEVGPDRMRARGLDEKGLEEYYRARNLLKAKITATHVAKAVIFFATRQTPTTGATIPVDGGLPDSTPR
jgi:rhamnose utilization protein RhaD (predicted bifunctional aldolase and dehydrogenase)/NAD(P)-dependent dehydrogenase (short-subunit alcohol dehydrogenase family)